MSRVAADGRNFRSSYYEKVGCYSVEEKKSLNKLLQDNIRNHAKLQQFCLSYTVPATQRSLLWSIILGILPLHKSSSEYIMEQRKAVYEDLLRAVTVMQFIDNNTAKSHVFQTMWLLENNRLLHPAARAKEEENNFEELVKVLLLIFETDDKNENDVETYWIAKEFFACTKEIQRDCIKLNEITKTLLQREDKALFNHLDKLEVFSNRNALDCWYATGFAGVINESALVKIWDKICGGSRKIVIFVFLEMVKAFRDSILNCKDQKDLKNIIEIVKDQDAAIVVNKAIKAWQSNKNHSEIAVH